jgi:hypothetical protein
MFIDRVVEFLGIKIKFLPYEDQASKFWDRLDPMLSEIDPITPEIDLGINPHIPKLNPLPLRFILFFIIIIIFNESTRTLWRSINPCAFIYILVGMARATHVLGFVCYVSL